MLCSAKIRLYTLSCRSKSFQPQFALTPPTPLTPTLPPSLPPYPPQVEKEDVPVLLVGGGGILVDRQVPLKGASRVIIPEKFGVSSPAELTSKVELKTPLLEITPCLLSLVLL